jgi:hypothetical protein
VELGDLTLSTTESAVPRQQTGFTRKPLFHPEADAQADIAAALAAAKREHKRVLLVWGTNASPGCYRLDEVMTKNEEIAAILHQGFVPLLVDVDANVKDTNLKLPGGYVNPRWRLPVPFLRVLDSDGKIMTNEWTQTWGLCWPPINPDVAKLQAFLLQWSPSL